MLSGDVYCLLPIHPLPLSPGNHTGGRSRKPAGPAPGGARAGPGPCEMEFPEQSQAWSGAAGASAGRLRVRAGLGPPLWQPRGRHRPRPVFPVQGHVRGGPEGDGAGGGPDPRRVLQRDAPDPALHLHGRAGAQPEQRPGDAGRCLPAPGEAPARGGGPPFTPAAQLRRGFHSLGFCLAGCDASKCSAHRLLFVGAVGGLPPRAGPPRCPRDTGLGSTARSAHRSQRSFTSAATSSRPGWTRTTSSTSTGWPSSLT